MGIVTVKIDLACADDVNAAEIDDGGEYIREQLEAFREVLSEMGGNP
jgi:hypothetical protein